MLTPVFAISQGLKEVFASKIPVWQKEIKVGE